MSLTLRSWPSRRGVGPKRRRISASLALVATIGALLAPGTGITPAEAQEPATYVALGDSFTAGPLIPNQSTEPLGCLRSDRNYPHLVAQATGYALTDVSCSGADTDDMFSEQGVTPGPNPPQLNALDAGTDLVTLGIGGNDIGFGSIIEDCVTVWPFGSPCRDQYTEGGQDELSNRIAATAPKVSNVLEAIAQRSPEAHVLVVGYPAIVPHSGFGCWPSLPLAWADVAYVREKHIELNAMLAEQAALHGATYVDVYTPSQGRDACASPTNRWVEPLVPASLAAPVHPNARGMAGMADVIDDAV